MTSPAPDSTLAAVEAAGPVELLTRTMSAVPQGLGVPLEQ